MKKKEDATPETPDNERKDAAEITGATPDEPALPAGEEAITPEKLESVERERDQYLEMARRSRADYVNLQRRMDAQGDQVREATRQEFAKAILSVLDDLESALKHANEGADCSGIVSGLEIVRTKFLSTLSKYGIEPMEAVGEPFDHNLHHAIAEHPTDDAAPGTVYAVALKGYTAGGKLLRPAHVVVAKKPVGQAEREEDGGDEEQEDD